jgi:hypothetical protein
VKRTTLSLIALFMLLSLSAVNVSATNISRTARASNVSSGFPGFASGYVYAIYASVPGGSGNITYGPSISVGVSCTTPTASSTLTKSGTIIPINSLVNSGTATSTITVNRTATALSIQSTEEIKNLKLLGGLITASDLKAHVSSTSTTSGTSSTNDSAFSGLNISGISESIDPAPNTTRSIPLVGTVTLNEQAGPTNGLHSSKIAVIMMDVRVTRSNTLGFAVGSRIIVAYARSGILPSAVTATAYGLYAFPLGSSIPAAGPVALTGIECDGGSSTNTVNSFNSATFGSTGYETSSASGQITASDATATSHNNISTLNLLNSFASAESITTTATADVNGTTGSSSGSTVFVNGNLNGTPLSDNPAPNTRENLPGIGYAIVNEQFASNSSSNATQTVIAMDIYVNTANNPLNLPVGTRILVGVATAGAGR